MTIGKVYEPELTVGVDEFTLVLQPTGLEDMTVDDWEDKIGRMLVEFLGKSKIELLFGNLQRALKGLQVGYTDSLTYTDQPWLLTISWHETRIKMGICVRFSAYAYAAYKQAFREQYQTDINIALFLQMVQGTEYTTRLSRIDLTADYKNYRDPLVKSASLSPHYIYDRLMNGVYKIKNHEGKSTIKTFLAMHKNGTYETFYAGAKKGKTDGFLRCYDKKEEQLQSHGFRFQEAEDCESWVRFEAVYRHNYAHQITNQLLEKSDTGNYIIQTDAELQKMIAMHIVEKYCFYDMATDEPTSFSSDLDVIAAGASVDSLSRPNARDNDLQRSIRYLASTSGLFSTFYKVGVFWGKDGEKALLEHLTSIYENSFEPEAGKNPDIRYWLKKHWDALINTRLEDSF